MTDSRLLFLSKTSHALKKEKKIRKKTSEQGIVDLGGGGGGGFASFTRS